MSSGESCAAVIASSPTRNRGSYPKPCSPAGCSAMRPSHTPSQITGVRSPAIAHARQHAAEAGGAGVRRHALQFREQLGVVRRRIRLVTGVARRKNAGTATEGVDFEAGIVRDRGQSGCGSGVARLESAFSTNVEPVSSTRRDAEMRLRQHDSMPLSASKACSSRELSRDSRWRAPPASNSQSPSASSCRREQPIRCLGRRGSAARRVRDAETHGLRPYPASR